MHAHARIGFKRHLRPEVVKGEAVYLFGENGVTALQGPHVEELAPLLDGSRDVPALLRDLPDDLPAERVARLLARLRAAGLVSTREDEEPGDEDALAYWEAAGLDASAAVTGTRNASVRVLAVGDATPELAASALRRAGLTATVGAAGDSSADLTVVVCTDYLAPELKDVDEEQRRAGKPWLLLKPTGVQAWVGPVLTPGEGACWRCLATQLSANRPAEAHVQASRGRVGPVARPGVSLFPVVASACGVAGLEAAKWLAGHRHDSQREIWVLDSLTLGASHHRVRALPQCPACGDPDAVRRRARRPVVIESRPKRSVDGGGHRSATPREVLDRYRHLVSPVTGIVRDIRRDSRGHDFFNSYSSAANVAASGSGVDGLRSTLRRDSGKGVTPLHAEVSALCEALERYSGTYHGDEATVRASFRDLGDEAVHPDAFQLFHPRQFEHRAEWNAAHGPFQHVPEPFDEHAQVDWTPMWSLTDQCHRLLPTGCLYYGAPGPPSVAADSNGCAAGASVEDAVLQGLLEVIERDAVALWWYNRTAMPGVDLDALGDPFVDELREVYRELGREVWVLDLTADLSVPVMAAITRRPDGPREDIMFGFGAHLDPRLAVRRALTELNQVMPSVDGLREEDLPTLDVDLRRWLRTATAAGQPYLLPDSVRPLGEYTPAEDLATDIHTIQERLEAAGLEPLVLDQTRPDVGLAVVKVVVPGMRHHWSRLAPGRLYDIPVRLRRVERPVAYHELNPIPMFM